MAESLGGDKEGVDEELSAMLDSALGEFNAVKNTDDELDSMMVSLDNEAAQRAARSFDLLVKNIGDAAGGQKGDEQTAEVTTEEQKAAENFQNMLKALVEAEERALKEDQNMEVEGEQVDMANAQAFLDQMKSLSEQDPSNLLDESQMEPLMNLVRTFFDKNLMYPSVKQLYDNYPAYLSSHPELDAQLRARYEKQVDVLRRICEEYEKEETTVDAEKRARFEAITNLMVEMQSYGYPPEELVGAAPQGWAMDPLTGVPRIVDVNKAADTCSLM